MKKNILIYLLPIIAVFAFASCERDDINIAGKGGNATLKITPMHHDDVIDSATVFIKYNAQELPTSYDEHADVVMENGVAIATFSGLKKGQYYIYAEGWDHHINEKVIGGIPYTITEESTLEINVPVTEEGH